MSVKKLDSNIYSAYYSTQLFHGNAGTVKLLSRGSGEDLENSCQRPTTMSTTEGQWFDCSPNSLKITVLLPIAIVLNHPNTVNSKPMLVVDIRTFDVSWRHLSRDQPIVHY